MVASVSISLIMSHSISSIREIDAVIVMAQIMIGRDFHSGIPSPLENGMFLSMYFCLFVGG